VVLDHQRQEEAVSLVRWWLSNDASSSPDAIPGIAW
jgi:hypothetical protein